MGGMGGMPPGMGRDLRGMGDIGTMGGMAGMGDAMGSTMGEMGRMRPGMGRMMGGGRIGEAPPPMEVGDYGDSDGDDVLGVEDDEVPTRSGGYLRARPGARHFKADSLDAVD
jgi:hypothetical protein